MIYIRVWHMSYVYIHVYMYVSIWYTYVCIHMIYSMHIISRIIDIHTCMTYVICICTTVCISYRMIYIRVWHMSYVYIHVYTYIICIHTYTHVTVCILCTTYIYTCNSMHIVVHVYHMDTYIYTCVLLYTVVHVDHMDTYIYTCNSMHIVYDSMRIIYICARHVYGTYHIHRL